ncbi:unnamed protein product [Bemisia tabaci]|uniref:Uncharacterized protein n=1 Tax=Bemisia tabaci TaxID=7038 RepID=A0A9P0F656_BEMTA|nr:unnamed protein product [Bemisia tabaci]
MKPVTVLLSALCMTVLVISARGAALYPQQEECDEDNQQRTVNNEDFIRNAGYRSSQNTLHLGPDGSKFREHYEKLKQKADQFVGSSGTIPQDLGVDLNGGAFNKLEAGSQTSSSSFHSSGVNAGIRTPVATNFYNNDGSLLHTVEGLKAHGQGVQFTATGGILPLKNYQEGQVFSHNGGGYGGSFEKHSSSHSEHSRTSNSGLPITFTPYEKHHQSSSINVQETVKRRNYTDYLEPELISQKTSTVVHPLNVAYGAQSAGTYNQGLKTHANYDHSNSGSYGLYQVPMTVIPVLGSNDANYLSETKSQSLSKTLISSHDSTHGAVDAKPIKIQTGSYVRPTPSGVDQMWHKIVQGQSYQVNNNPGVLQTSFGTTEAESDDSLQTHVSPIALSAPQSSQYVSKSESQKSESSSSLHESSSHQSGSYAGGQSLQSQGQAKVTAGGRAPVNTFVGDPNAPQNSGFAITGENKGFYAKSVELANLLSATIAPMETNENQAVQQSSQQSSSSSQVNVIPSRTGVLSGSQDSYQSGYAGGYGGGVRSGYQSNYEKHHSSSSHSEKSQTQNLNGQESVSGVPVINEPYRLSGGGSTYDWSARGGGFGQYAQHAGSYRQVGGHAGHDSGRQISNAQSWQSSSLCGECGEGVGQIQYGYQQGTPVKSSYGLSSRFAASSSDINGQRSESKSASVTINDNGKIDTYNRHTK